jgi:hypothetical protein
MAFTPISRGSVLPVVAELAWAMSPAGQAFLLETLGDLAGSRGRHAECLSRLNDCLPCCVGRFVESAVYLRMDSGWTAR